VGESGEAAATAGFDLGCEGVKEMKQDWLGDVAEVFGGCAQVEEGGLVVDGGGGFVVGDFADAVVDAEVFFWQIWMRISGGRGEECGSGSLEIEICHCVFHGVVDMRKLVIRAVRCKK
jgi:hypothetical protein